MSPRSDRALAAFVVGEGQGVEIIEVVEAPGDDRPFHVTGYRVADDELILLARYRTVGGAVAEALERAGLIAEVAEALDGVELDVVPSDVDDPLAVGS